MSISLKQLTAMVDIAEALAIEMRELIALRKIIASQSVKRSRMITSKSARHSPAKPSSKFTGHVHRTKVNVARSPDPTVPPSSVEACRARRDWSMRPAPEN